MSKILILTASPRKEGNTNSIVKAFCRELDELGKSYETVDLYDEDMKPCIACRKCQESMDSPACVQGNEELFDKVLEAELIVLATPVYSWYCTPPAKAFLDRCVYAMNKYYGTETLEPAGIGKGPALWEGKSMALITTYGYPANIGPDLLEEGIKRYCRHSKLKYAGMLAERHEGYNVEFLTEDKINRAKGFAKSIAL